MKQIAACLLLALLTACAAPSEETPRSLTLYSGRNERLVDPIIERFTEASGIEVRVRYGGATELAATLLEEGRSTPAQLFFSPDAAALGALSREGLLVPMPESLLARVPARFRAADGDWVGTSGRARSVVYNTERLTPAELPDRLAEVGDPKWRGRFGLAPTNTSFQAHMAMIHVLEGEQALRELLAAMRDNEPMRYPKNSPIVEAVIAGEVDWGLVNHYYLWRALSERPDAPGKNHFMTGDAMSGFVNLAGLGLLHETPEALELVEFLLGDEAQRYFAEETFEYPLVPGIEPAVELPPLESVIPSQVDFRKMSQILPETQRLIEESGLTRFN